MVLGVSEAGQGERQDAVGAHVAVAVGVVGGSDEHVHGVRQRVLDDRVLLTPLQFALQPPDVHLSASRRAARRSPAKCTVIAKFHYTDPTGPARTLSATRTDLHGLFCGETPLGPCGSPTKSVRVRSGPCGSPTKSVWVRSGPCNGI